MKKYKKFLKPFIYSILFIFFIVISYRSAKPRYKPENFTDIFNDFSPKIRGKFDEKKNIFIISRKNINKWLNKNKNR